MQTITAVIPTKNEEKNIEQCLKSLLWCNKIIVIVTGTDKTDRIAKKLGARTLFDLKQLEDNGNLHHFPQLVENSGSRVSQAEHTLLISEKEGVIVTTI